MTRELLQCATFHLAILGSRDVYHCVAKNHTANKTVNAWLTAEEVCPWAKQKNSEGFTVWVSLNAKEQGKDNIKGVCALCDFWLDVDSKRLDKSKPATQAELQETLNRAAKLKEHIEITYGAIGFLAYSGNGFHLHFPLPRFELVGQQFREEINKKVRAFAKKASATVKAEIDSAYDIRRVTTLIGTLNLKIPELPLQTRWDKEIFTEGYEQAVGYVDRVRELNKVLLEAILNTETKCHTTSLTPIQKHPILDNLLLQDTKLAELFEGNWQKHGYKSRSEAEQAVLAKLVLKGFGDDEINEAMKQCIIGKWQERDDSYRTVSIDHAREQVAKYQAGKAEFFDRNGKFVPAKLAEFIMEKNTFITMKDNQETYVHINGFYQPLGDVLIKQEVKDALQDDYRKNKAAEVLDFIKASTYATRKEEPPNLIPLENGVLDVSKEPFELKPHSPKYMFFNKLPVKYDPNAVCPAIKNFLREITDSEEDVTILEEVIGFCLYREYFIAKALMLVGEGSNGKSTFLNMVKAFLSVGNVSGRSLQDLELHRFAKADLHTKLANIYADLPDKALQSTGTFKMLTGRDLIAAEKKFQRTFHFENYAKLMFSANKVPEAKDDTSAFFRRWIIIIFPKTFTGSKADPHILERLTTEKELSGLLNLALDGLKRLLKTGQFSNSKTTEEIKEDYIRKSSPIAAFVLDCLETDSDAFIEKKALYAVFAEYCRNLKLPTVLQDTFFKNLPKHMAVSDYRPTVGKNRFYALRGIRYSSNASNVSTVSRAFYTLTERSGQLTNGSYKVTEIPNTNFIKIDMTLDAIDSIDTGIHKPSSPLNFFDHVVLCWNTCLNYHNNGEYGCTHPNPLSLNEKTVRPLKCPGFKPFKEASNG